MYFAGVTMMLDHLVDLGVETVWITPFFKSTMLDMGYDIENYTAIEPTYGTMHDFEELMKELKERGMSTVFFNPFQITLDILQIFRPLIVLCNNHDIDIPYVKLGLKLIIDFVINHTSNKHSWFTKSIDRIEPYTDFYVWKDAKSFEKNGDPIPPNNWVSDAFLCQVLSRKTRKTADFKMFQVQM